MSQEAMQSWKPHLIVKHPTNVFEVCRLEVDVWKRLHPDAELLDAFGSDKRISIPVSKDKDPDRS